METGRVFDAIAREMRSASGSWLNRREKGKIGEERITVGKKIAGTTWKKEAREKWRGRVSIFHDTFLLPLFTLFLSLSPLSHATILFESV